MHELDLGRIFEPCPPATFLLEYFGQQFLHARGVAGRFAHLLPREPGGDRLDEVWPPAASLAQSLGYTLEAPVRMRLSTGSEALAAQRVQHDVIILQASGHNCWRIYDGSGTEPGEVVWESKLEDGDALYIPQGCWHSASEEIGSQRLEISIRNPTGTDLMLWLATVVKDMEVFQTPIPRFSGPAERAAYITGIRQNLRGILLRPGLLERFRRHLNRNAKPRRLVPSESWEPELPTTHLIVLSAARPIRIQRDGDQSIYFRLHGERFTFPAEAAQFLHFLTDRAPVAVADFYETFKDEFDREELFEFLSVLAAQRIIAFRAPDDPS